MRVLIKRLLKKYHYPPEGQEQALLTVMEQCNKWADNEENFYDSQVPSAVDKTIAVYSLNDLPQPMAAENDVNDYQTVEDKWSYDVHLFACKFLVQIDNHYLHS